MRYGIMLALGAMATLSGCGDSGEAERDASGEVTKAGMEREMASATRLTPGQYDVRMQAIRFDIPGMPPEQAQMMQQMMAGVGAQTQSQCVTEARSRGSIEDMYKGLAEGNCSMQRFNIDGDQMTGQMTCDAGSGRSSEIAIRGTMGETSSETTMTMAMRDPSLPQGRAEMEMRVTMNRTGDCTAESAAAAAAAEQAAERAAAGAAAAR